MGSRARAHQSRGGGTELRPIVGAIRLRQDHFPAPAAQPGDSRRAARSASRGEPLAGRTRTRPRHRVPALLGFPSSDRGRERGPGARVRHARASSAACSAPSAVGPCEEATVLSRSCGPGGGARQISGGAVRRHAATARHRPGAGHQAARAAARRAVRRARSSAPRRRCTS